MSPQLIHPNSQLPYKKKIICNYCKIPGLYKKECQKYLAVLKVGKVYHDQSLQMSRPSAFASIVRTTVTNSIVLVLINDWYLDSRATHHLIYHGKWLLAYSPIYLWELVYLGDNTV